VPVHARDFEIGVYLDVGGQQVARVAFEQRERRAQVVNGGHAQV
jgi:hypothetical protein